MCVGSGVDTYVMASEFMECLLLNGACTGKEMSIFLRKFASCSEEMRRWLRRWEEEGGGESRGESRGESGGESGKSDVSCYNELVDMLRIEGDEESATRVIDEVSERERRGEEEEREREERETERCFVFLYYILLISHNFFFPFFTFSLFHLFLFF